MKGQPGHGCCTALVPRLPRLELGFGLKDAKDAKDEGVIMRQGLPLKRGTVSLL